MPFADPVTSLDELRQLYRHPAKGAVAKEQDRLDEHCRAVISRSSFFLLATSGADGSCDVTPRGGDPGFVAVLDDRRLAFADLAGNNRLDSMENVVANPGVGMIFLLPGRDETLRVNGRATITLDPVVRQACAIRGVVPNAAIGVDVEQAYIHCAKALRRGGLWDTRVWPDLSDLASAAAMLKDQCHAEVDASVIAEALERNAVDTMWASGGR